MSSNMIPAGWNGNGPGEPIAYKGVRVMTTEMLAQAFGADAVRIQQNYLNNKARFPEGTHCFKVEGRDLADLRLALSEAQISSKTRSLLLWPERGAFGHAKILGTDEAWTIHERLVDTYFAVKENRAAPAIDVRNPAQLAQIAAQLIEVNQEMEKRAVAAEQAVEATKPVVEAFDRIANADGNVNMTLAAKALQVSPHWFMKWCDTNGWTYKRGNQRMAYQDKVNAGYLYMKTDTVERPDGSDKAVYQVFVTPKGLTKLAKLLGGSGGAPATLPLLRPNGLGRSSVHHAPAME